MRRRSKEEEVMADTESADARVHTLWTDDAIDSDNEDNLDRKRFADMVADRVDACVLGQKSTVFGLVGPWGSGKTSLINFVRKRLADDWKIAIFSPWASDTAAGLQFEFLAAVASLLDGEDEKSRNAKTAMRKYASVCAPLLKAIPYAGAGLGGAAEKALELTNPPWHRQYEDVSKILASLGSRVLLIADDIDRLDADELLSLLKVVRLLGRFPNVHYLIAYDQATVESLLRSKELASRSTAFMEKIVQYPFEVPPIARVIQRRLLVKTINELIERFDIRLNATHGERFSDYIAVLADGLATPRAHARFEQQLLAFGGMLNFKEVDVVDFVALSFLRIFYHDIYAHIPIWKNALQSGKVQTGLFAQQVEIDDNGWIELINPHVNSEKDAILVKNVLGGLFPGIHSSLLYAKVHKLALSDDIYFQRYFLFGIAEDDVEDQLIESALLNIVIGDDAHSDVIQFRNILDSQDNQRAALAYEKGQRHRSDDHLGPSRNLALFLFDRLNSLSNEDHSFESAQRPLWRWVEEEAFNALSSCKLTVADMLAALSSKNVLSLTVRMLRDTRHSEAVARDALTSLGDHYYGSLTNDLVGLLDSGLDFNWVVSTVAFLKKDIDLHSIGEGLLDEGNIDTLDRLVQAMIIVNQWRAADGVSPELAFHSETLSLLFDDEAIIRLADGLPDAPPIVAINRDDTSSENRATFARAAVKSIAAGLSS